MGILQSGDDAGTALNLKSSVDSKSFNIVNANGDVDFQFMASHAGTPYLHLGADAYISFEGSTANGSETILTVTNPTGDRTITLPDETGTVHTSGGSITIPDAGTIGSASDADAIAISAGGVVTMNQIPVFSAGINVSGGTIAGTLATAAQTNITSLGTLTALTVDDINLNGKVLTITGDTSDTFTITSGTHGATTLATTDAAGTNGLLTLDADGRIHLDAADAGVVIIYNNGTRYSSFDNSGSDFNINNLISDGDILFKGSDGGSGITALTLDMSAAGAATFNAGITSGAGLVIANAGTIGSASDTDAIAISSGGVVTMNQIPVFSAGINVSGGTIAGTLATAAQTNITSVGTLTALTVDDINLNGKVLTITGDTSDTFTITSGANGATTLATTDAAGANGNLTLDADGDIRLDSNSGYGHVYLYNNGTKYAVFINSGNDFWIENDTNNGDTLFKGIDDGALFTALTLDMSDAGTAIFNHDIKIADGGFIGSASDADAIAISAGGVVTMNQIPIFSAGINVSGGTIAGTLATAAQANITSVGTLTTLTVDNIVINGTNIGHTSDTDAIAISSGGVVTMNQIPVFSAGINVSGGTIAGTLATAAQTNITSVGTLTALTVDSGSSSSLLEVVSDDDGNSIIRARGASQGTGALEVGQSTAYGGGISYNGDGSPGFVSGETADHITFYRMNAGTRTEVFAYPYNGDTVTFNGSINATLHASVTATTQAVNNSATSVATTAFVAGKHKYHTFTDEQYYFDNYIGSRYLRLFTETAGFDIARFNTPSNVQFFDYSLSTPAFVTYTDGVADIEKILDGREETGINVSHAKRRFRFEITTDTGYPTTVLVMLQLTWSAIVQTAMTVVIEEWDGSAWNVVSTSNFAAGEPGSTGADQGTHIKAETGMHNGRALKRIEITFADWTDSGAYTTMPLRRFGMFSNFTGAAGSITPWTWNFDKRVTFGGSLVIPNAGTIGSTSDTDAIAIGSDGDVTLTQDLELQHDGATLSFGTNNDVILTHVHNTGLLLNSTMALQFNDASQYINAPSTTVLDITATDEIELNATLLDVNANINASGTYTGAGLMTTGGNIVIPNAGTIGSASDTDAIAISSGGVVTMNQIPVFSAGINVSGGSITGSGAGLTAGTTPITTLNIGGGTSMDAAVVDADLLILYDNGSINKKLAASTLKTYMADLTLTTAAQTNITSVGTLTALTVDDINLNGKVLTITGDTSDTFTITTGAAGATTLATTDAAGAVGHLTLDADGEIILDAGDASGTTSFKNSGTTYAQMANSGTSSYLVNIQSDGNIFLRGNDGGAYINALELDFSDAGTAIFNHDIYLKTDSSHIDFGVNAEIRLAHVHDTGLLLTDSGGTPTLQLHDANESVSSDGSKLILTSNGVAFNMPTADGSSGQVLKTNGSRVLSFTDLPASDPDPATTLASDTDCGTAAAAADSLDAFGVAIDDAFVELDLKTQGANKLGTVDMGVL